MWGFFAKVIQSICTRQSEKCMCTCMCVSEKKVLLVASSNICGHGNILYVVVLLATLIRIPISKSLRRVLNIVRAGVAKIP